MSKPTIFTPELGERICAKIAQGDSVREACEPEDMPNWRTFMRWLATQDAEPKEGEERSGAPPFDSLRQHYARARELRADARFERMDVVIADMRAGTINDRQARVELDTIKWQAGKENAKRYGDAVTLRGDKDSPLEVRSEKAMTEAELQAIAQGGLRNAE